MPGINDVRAAAQAVGASLIAVAERRGNHAANSADAYNPTPHYIPKGRLNRGTFRLHFAFHSVRPKR